MQSVVHAEAREQMEDKSQRKVDADSMNSDSNKDDERFDDPHSDSNTIAGRRASTSPVSQRRTSQAGHDKEDDNNSETEQKATLPSAEKTEPVGVVSAPQEQLTLQPKSRIPRKPLRIPNEFIMAEGPHWYRIETKGSKQWRIQMKWMTEQKMIDFWEQHKRFTFAVMSEEYDRFI